MNLRERFEVGKKIDEGSFGAVHQGGDRLTGKAVAIKFLKDAADLRRFAREAQILWQQLDNEFVVDFIAAHLEGEGPFYIVMEYCSLGSLRPWVKERRPWPECALVLGHVAHGLHGLHRIGGFHRDLKPENILLGHNKLGQKLAKIVDFGLARMPLPGSNMTNTGWGTMGYIAPEILLGHSFDARADIYSLGVVAHELLTGGRTLGALASTAIPAELRDLVQRMLSTAPSARPMTQQIGQAMKHLLDKQAAAPSPPPPAPPPPPPPSSSGPDWSKLGKLALGLFVGGAALSALGDGGKKWDGDVGRYRGKKDGRFKSG